MTTRDTRRATPPGLSVGPACACTHADRRGVSGVRFLVSGGRRSPTLSPSASLRLCVKKNHSPRLCAFTLIETALAMLAIGLGLMAIFGLGRLGLQSNKESLNDQRCVQMADAIFETLREYNARFVDEARTNLTGYTWHQHWEAASGTTSKIPFPIVANMSTSELLFLTFATDPTTLQSAYDENVLSLSDWNPRYRLSLYDDPDPVTRNRLIRVRLVIYPDGNTDSSESRSYATTLSNPGGLP